MKIYGLTGGIACGKSTVGSYFKDLGVPVIDADASSRTVMMPGHVAYLKIKEAFGESICQSDGHIDRQKLGEIVFSDKEKLRRLESITHPAIRLDIANQLKVYINRGHTIAIVEAALLVENGSYRQYAGLIVVTCQPDLQRNRLMNRNGFTYEEATVRIAAQLPLDEKEAVANWVIHNDGDLNHLKAETHRIFMSINNEEGC